MMAMAIKFLSHNGNKAFRVATHKIVRTASTDGPCPPKQLDPSKPKEPCPSKAEPCSHQPTTSSSCPSPPPCPPMPQCPPTICPPILDSNNPCNYCRPPCPDPDSPDLTRLKKMQCLFQEENDIPVYLKKGTADALLVQTTYVTIIVSLLAGLYKVL